MTEQNLFGIVEKVEVGLGLKKPIPGEQYAMAEAFINLTINTAGIIDENMFNEMVKRAHIKAEKHLTEGMHLIIKKKQPERTEGASIPQEEEPTVGHKDETKITTKQIGFLKKLLKDKKVDYGDPSDHWMKKHIYDYYNIKNIEDLAVSQGAHLIEKLLERSCTDCAKRFNPKGKNENGDPLMFEISKGVYVCHSCKERRDA